MGVLTRESLDADWQYFEFVRQVQVYAYKLDSEGLDTPVTCDAFPAGGQNEKDSTGLEMSEIHAAERIWHLRNLQLEAAGLFFLPPRSVIEDNDGRRYLVGDDIRYQTYKTRIRCVCSLIPV